MKLKASHHNQMRLIKVYGVADQMKYYRLINQTLRQTFPLMFAQLHPDLRRDIIESAIGGQDIQQGFVGAPSDAATLDFIDWVQVIGAAATVLSVGFQVYQISLERGKAKAEAKKDAIEEINQHPQITRIKVTQRETLIREFEATIEKEP